MRTLHGMNVHGFPNAFVVGPTQAANLISNIPHNLVEAGETIATIVAHAESIEAAEVEVTREAEDTWVALLEAGGRTFGGDPTCTPGYYNNEGPRDQPLAAAQHAGIPRWPSRVFRVHQNVAHNWRLRGPHLLVTERFLSSGFVVIDVDAACHHPSP